MIKLKKLLKETITWNNRKFGERLPTLSDYKKAHDEKNGKKITEVGAGYDYHKVNKQVEKSYRKYWDDVQALEKIMIKKGLKSKAREVHREYSKKVLGFQVYLRGIIDRLL